MPTAKSHINPLSRPRVYFVRAAETGLIKIGSSVYPNKRAKGLQTARDRALWHVVDVRGRIPPGVPMPAAPRPVQGGMYKARRPV